MTAAREIVTTGEKASDRRRRRRHSAAELLDMLRRHHGLTGPADAWAGGILVHEVSPNGSMAGEATRRADAVFVGFTAASGRCLVGYELKTSRDDWRRELARGAQKADGWADQCHEWWIVVSDPAIVRDGELPQGWGLMSPPTGGGHRMTVHVKAHRKSGHTPSWDAVRAIMSRSETLRAEAIKSQLWQLKIEAQRDARRDVEAEYAARRTPDVAELQRRIALIEDALGARLDWGDGGMLTHGVSVQDLVRFGAAVREYGNITATVEAITERARGQVAAVCRQAEYLVSALARMRDCVHDEPAPGPDAQSTGPLQRTPEQGGGR
ncbi:hypothetical protein KL864_31830 [Mycolicibacterium goodii]|uniref:hypothetical protein n=1 Tax=Mycolicibacterium goodii TaxID=134601 RepID=UPI001BDC9827|nr:hypothetical protein [Mycolicibacterium goodii]MBU8820467.1 hypothetical protein [Mycolicibacterium goodii]